MAAGKYPDLVVEHVIDKPVLLIDPPGPAAREVMFQRLGFAQAREWIALRFANQAQNSGRL